VHPGDLAGGFSDLEMTWRRHWLLSRKSRSSCKLDNSWATEGFWFQNLHIGFLQFTLGFQGHGFKGQGHSNVFLRRRTDQQFTVDFYLVKCRNLGRNEDEW